MTIIGQHDVEFRRDGSVYDEAQVEALLGGLKEASDLIVLAHGWNNDMADAGRLYDGLLGQFEVLPAPVSGPASRIVVMRIFWPSKRFTDEELIPGGGVASLGAKQDIDVATAVLRLAHDPERLGGSQAEDPTLSAFLDAAIALVPRLDSSVDARRKFVESIRSVLKPGDAHPDDGSDAFFSADPEELFVALSQPVPLVLAIGGGGVAAVGTPGGATGLGDLRSGALAAARRVANFATYLRMKDRAGQVGERGLAPVLERVRATCAVLPLHLVGHSFGGRLVVAAASRLPACESPDSDVPVTITLLQAAFSHNGLAAHFDGIHNGAFHNVVDTPTVTGPIVITHTKNDRAVGIAYPLASRIVHDRSAALGEANDPYGGMGRNGAQHTSQVNRAEAFVRDQLHDYDFHRRTVYNLNGDRVISNHSDVTGVPIANVVLSVITAGVDWLPTSRPATVHKSQGSD